MMDQFLTLSPILQALIATLFTWAITALGAGTVLLTRNVSNRFLNAMLGFAAGVMIAAAYWSLLAPSIELSRGGTLPVWFAPMAGFLLGRGSVVDHRSPATPSAPGLPGSRYRRSTHQLEAKHLAYAGSHPA